tara:strand:+ start:18634 stop:18831 length:198 start_codon:yes stop_codon:yes gene_type:complete
VIPFAGSQASPKPLRGLKAPSERPSGYNRLYGDTCFFPNQHGDAGNTRHLGTFGEYQTKELLEPT